MCSVSSVLRAGTAAECIFALGLQMFHTAHTCHAQRFQQPQGTVRVKCFLYQECPTRGPPGRVPWPRAVHVNYTYELIT